MRSKLAAAIAVSAVLTTAAACSHNPAVTRRAPGTATGTLIFGGPGPSPSPVPGKVIVIDVHGHKFQASADSNGHFSISLPAGTYEFNGSSPKVTINGSPAPCGAAHSVRITAHQATHNVKVFCDLP